MKRVLKLKVILLATVLLVTLRCGDLDTINQNNPDLKTVFSSGSDLISIGKGGYIAWWQGLTDSHPAMAMAVTSDQYGLSWGNFGMRRMGEEPRRPYNNRATEAPDYKQLVEDPWFGLTSAASTANDLINAIDINNVGAFKNIGLSEPTSIDDGGPQDQSVVAAALFLRGISRGYLGLIFDQALLPDETTDLSQPLTFVPYAQVIPLAIADIDAAIAMAKSAGSDFSHGFFNGVALDDADFVKLAHSYAARILASWPRTETEAASIDWASVQSHASQGLDFDFAPNADGNFWVSYHRWAFKETGQGIFWAHVDQRIIAAFDSAQPTRYPEVIAKGEAPINPPQATTADARLALDFAFVAPDDINLPQDRGEWHYSHYKHNRNISDPGFAGDGSTSGPMPVFLAADNDLLLAEAFLRQNMLTQAINIVNAGTRVTRGQLTPLSATATFDEIKRAILYERAIELLSTSPLGMWFDRRRIGPRLPFDGVDDLGGLQLNTPAQLPVPADELSIHQLDPYNFGGSQDPLGIDRI